MKLQDVFQDTVCLMEGGHVSRARRPGEHFEGVEIPSRRMYVPRLLPVTLIILILVLQAIG
ncbi:MAG: hypothetical protein R3E39_15830 [Anaerolineae bacterium]